MKVIDTAWLVEYITTSCRCHTPQWLIRLACNLLTFRGVWNEWILWKAFVNCLTPLYLHFYVACCMPLGQQIPHIKYKIKIRFQIASQSLTNSEHFKNVGISLSIEILWKVGRRIISPETSLPGYHGYLDTAFYLFFFYLSLSAEFD